jgi:predicted dehydrogenase
VLVEKPMAASLEEADRLIAAAKRSDRVLQIGHVERFNPAVAAAQKIVSRPMFFEVHRLGIFTPRSLDIDVVYDVMIHDLDILLSLVPSTVVDLKAVGIPVITDKVDIAHARVEFDTGTVANITASRVSTERVRKMRFFQEHEYISLDFARQDALRIRVKPGDIQPEIGFEKLPAAQEEPLHAELRAFLESVRTRKTPVVDGAAGRRALELADRVMAGILDHGRRVQLGAFTPQEIR